MRAIVIDDSRAMRGILKRILTNAGWETSEAPDGREALKALTGKPPPELALVDWNMPNMNGLEFIREIRKNDAFASMRIIMVTTEVEMHQMVAALDAGANEYVMKPFTEESFNEKLALLTFDKVAA